MWGAGCAATGAQPNSKQTVTGGCGAGRAEGGRWFRIRGKNLKNLKIMGNQRLRRGWLASEVNVRKWGRRPAGSPPQKILPQIHLTETSGFTCTGPYRIQK